MFEPRPYQEEISNKANVILRSHKIVYLAMQVRTGKTFTSLMTAEKYGARKVLFLTKKKAIKSIKDDYNLMKPSFEITIINDESIHKVEGNFDLVIHDEHHRCFLGSTKIDGVKIKDVKVGSFQKSFNFARGEYEKKKVLNVFKNPLTENLVKIKCNGKEIVCTESHKIFTKRGWVRARDILPTDELQVV